LEKARSLNFLSDTSFNQAIPSISSERLVVAPAMLILLTAIREKLTQKYYNVNLYPQVEKSVIGIRVTTEFFEWILLEKRMEQMTHLIQ
jgi:hypothetical protein